MESLLVLTGLIVLAIPISIIVLLVGQSRLRKRVEQLENQITEMSAGAIEQAPTTSPMSAAEQELSEEEKEQSKPAPWSAPTAEGMPAAVEREQTDTTAVEAEEDSGAIVFRGDRIAALGAWLRENWFYAVSALSLALAGIFLVQYGVENGLLPPTARVLAALAFGAALIVAGEVVRRRFGDDEDSATAYLPSVFSGAGLVTLFGGVLSARQLYDLIGPETALLGMVMIALLFS